MDPMATCPFVHTTLQDLRREGANQATVRGFVGLPYTLATYLVEGKSSKVSHHNERSDGDIATILDTLLSPCCATATIGVLGDQADDVQGASAPPRYAQDVGRQYW